MNFSTNNSLIASPGSGSYDLSSFVKLASYYCLASGVVILIFNSIILTALLRMSGPQTSFMVYVIQLTVTEIILTPTALLGSSLRSFYGFWSFGDQLCFGFAYLNAVLMSGARYGHALITLNRFWAVFFAVNYRNYHTRKVACTIVLLMWCFVHAIELPSVIVGRLNAKSDNKQCALNLGSMPGLVFLSNIIGFNFPYFIVLLLYPVITFKIYRQRAIRAQRNRVGVAVAIPAPVRLVVANQRSTRPVDEEQVESTSSSGQNNQVRRMGLYFRTLTFLTIAALICWTPNNVYFLMVYLSNYVNLSLSTAQNALVYTVSWMNPIVLYFSLDRLRQSVNRLFSHR